MNREEILERSRKEHKNRDFAELDVTFQAGNLAGRVGACVCCLISLLAYRMAHILLLSPWIIYFSILGSHYLVKYTKLKRTSDLSLTVLYLLMCLLAFFFFVLRLIGANG